MHARACMLHVRLILIERQDLGRAFTASTMLVKAALSCGRLAASRMTPITTASANVVTDWDEKAVAFIQPRMVPPVAYRAMAILHIAMFDAVNSIEPVYRPYYAQLPATRETSKEAAAA